MDQLNEKLFDMLINLDTFARIKPNTAIHLSQKGYFTPTGGKMSSLWGIQTLCNYVNAYSDKQLIFDLHIYFQHLQKLMMDYYELGYHHIIHQIDIACKIKLISRDFRFAYGDDTKGLFCLLKTYESSTIYEDMFEEVRDMMDFIKKYKRMTKEWLVLNKHNKLPYCPEADFTNEDWLLKIKASHHLQYETTGFYKFYILYTSSLLYNQTMSMIGYFHWMDEIFCTDTGTKIILGGMPLKSIVGRDDLTTIKNLEIKSILSVVECYENKSNGFIVSPIKPESWDEHDIHYLQLPICDFEEIPLEKIQTAVEYIHWNMKNKRSIYIHCRVAVARSVLMVMAYFVKYLGWSSEEAFNHIKSLRPQVQNKHRKLLEAYEQLLKN